MSYATDLVAADTDGALNLFVRDLGSGTTRCVNVNLAGLPTGNLTSLTASGVFDFNPVLSADGRYVSFESYVNDLVDNDHLCSTACQGRNGIDDVFVRDLIENTTALVSVNQAGNNGGNSVSSVPSISADGRFIAFRSFATDLTQIDNTPQSDIYVRDLAKRVTKLVSVNRTGTNAGSNGAGSGVNAYFPLISANGRFVAFADVAVDLAVNKTNVLPFDVFVRDLFSNTTTLVSVNRNGNDGGRDQNTMSIPRAFTADGRFLVFDSSAPDLVQNDANNAYDIFLRDLFTGTTALIDLNLAGVSTGDDSSTDAHITPDGRIVVFQSGASDLVPDDKNQSLDVFARTVFSGNPLDDSYFFTRQQYLDFLNREPDPGGYDYWTSQITQCGNDQTCVRNKRIDVSNAFFYEAEYQQTGAYVYRLYRAAYGNDQPFPNPDSSNPIEAQKLPSYAAFAPDRAQVVGGPSLAQSQLDLANTFVQRPGFLAKYPASLDGPTFVDALLATIKNDIGVDLTSQRAALLDLFNSGGRGAAIYRLADDNLQTNPINNRAFIDAEYNRAFVFTRYAGYLRRDSDIGGFLFWLGQVNRGPLRDGTRQHAMVCSFTTSAEYQLRFSLVVTHSNSECPQ
jgi:Tol biopolymer transport system component